MSLGLRRTVGNILPRLKYDARIGAFYTEDRVRDTDDVWRTEQGNIDRADFRAIFDMKNVEVGWLDFHRGAPPTPSSCRSVESGARHQARNTNLACA